MNELEYTAKQNKRAIESSIKGTEEALQDLKAMLAEDSIGGSRLAAWADGYVARDVAKVSALLARQSALQEAISIIASAEKQ